ncbi:MAG: MnhB domain-containing protein [Bacillota bacterium]
MNDLVLQTITYLLMPFIQVYGIFVVVNGHLSPGGGFPGGTILGASIILYALTFDVGFARDIYPDDRAEVVESTSVLIFVLIGLSALLGGYSFLTNVGILSGGETGTLFTGGFIMPVTLAIGAKVASTVITLFTHLFGERKP